MFNNIGRKIKGFAKFLFWIVVIIATIAGVIVIFQGIANSQSDAGEKVKALVAGLLIIAGGVILAWLQNFLLYGYGELIDCSQKILGILEEDSMNSCFNHNSVVVKQPLTQPVTQPVVQKTTTLQSIVEQHNSESNQIQNAPEQK